MLLEQQSDSFTQESHPKLLQPTHATELNCLCLK